MKSVLIGSALAIVIFLWLNGFNIMPLIIAAALILALFYLMLGQGQMKLGSGGSSRDKNSKLNFDQIGGQDCAINELQEALQFVMQPEKIDHMGIRPLKGILLAGPPGTGKTLMARAAASFTSSAFIAASGSEFIEMYAGVGAKRIRQIFSSARKEAKRLNKKSAIIFIDELEVLAAKRGSHSGHMEYDQTLNQLLVEMDGMSQNKDPRILLIGATNRADLLDPAVLRPGRFDRQVQVDLPDRAGRAKILSIHTRNKPLDPAVNLDDVSRATFGFSGAHLESLANEAAILAMREDSPIIKQNHFREAIDKVMMGEKLDRQPSLSEMERISIHESGHALVCDFLQPGSVASLTIVPRGKALGFMRRSPQDDQYLYTYEELEQQIMTMLAGALAEELRFGSRSSGARNDFQQAWNVAREMISSGLSSLGVVSDDHIPVQTVYDEGKRIIAAAESKTRTLLEENKERLFNLAVCLSQQESLGRPSLEKILYA
ncbi:MAG: AAA family ATPase [Syntrophomonadaceae bacterium]|nr:AAA family ATPase [Syntrophomonadaceae bacterium]